MKVLLPTPLIDYTAGLRKVSATGATLDAALVDLDRQFPGIRFRMIDEQLQVRAHIKLFVNRELERNLQRSLAESDELLVVAALSGG
jgi:molybdopterin converting factor small subunit